MAEQTSEQRAQEAQKADQARQENAKKIIAEQRHAREQAAKEAPEAPKPTPTQEENDMAAMGVHLAEHEPDGSPEQDQNYLSQSPHDRQHKQSEARKPANTGQYATRAATPKPAE